MKKLLLLTLIACSTVSVMAQVCSPDMSFVNAGPGVYPVSIATVDCSDTLGTKTIVSITDTLLHVTTPVVLDVSIYYDSTRVVSVSGLPAGLYFGTDVNGTTNAFAPYGAWVNGGVIPNLTPAVGCVYIYGSPAAWAAAASGGVGGTYTLVVEYDARIVLTDPDVSGFGVPNETWLSEVSPSLGGGTISFNVPIDANPINTLVATISGFDVVDASSSYTYTTNAGLSSYVWAVTGGTIQSGQGTNQISVIWDGGLAMSNVEVTVGDGGICDRTESMEIAGVAAGVNDIAHLNANVFPNPSNGQFKLQLDNTEPVLVEVFDVTGKQVLSEVLSGATNHVINMETSPRGVYVLRLNTEQGVGFKRLIKQ